MMFCPPGLMTKPNHQLSYVQQSNYYNNCDQKTTRKILRQLPYAGTHMLVFHHYL